MTKQKNYKKTLIACYLGFVTQAISANFTPLLFLTFKNTYGIGFEKIALIPLIFYLTQLLIDLAAAKFVDKIGYRTCVVSSQVLSAAGLVFMAILPELLPVPFIGILIAVVLYAVGSGLVEVLVSPIVEACPFENKEGTMSFLHSFYCWGAVGVILGSTLFFTVFGIENWKILTIIWALVPLYNAFNFIICPIERLVEDGKGMRTGQLLKLPLFWLLILLMICAGASEASMAAVGVRLYRVSNGCFQSRRRFGRTLPVCGIYGNLQNSVRKNERQAGFDQNNAGVRCILRDLLPDGVLVLFADHRTCGCALCGVSVGIMWPGTISISSQKCPRGGTAMFAFLALAGDLGATVSPATVGGVSNLFGGDLKTGLFVATAFPLILVLGLAVLDRKFNRGSK